MTINRATLWLAISAIVAALTSWSLWRSAGDRASPHSSDLEPVAPTRVEDAEFPRDGDQSEAGPNPRTAELERQSATSEVAINVKFREAAPQSTEIVVVALADGWESALRRPYGVTKEEIERQAIRYVVPNSGTLTIPRPSSKFCLGARAKGTAPFARIVEPDVTVVEIALDEGLPFRVAAFDHANILVAGASFEVYFDARTTLEKDPDSDIAQLAILPLFHSSAFASEDAVATIQNLAPGVYRIIARHQQYADGLGWGAIVPMTVDPFIVSLEPRAAVDGFVRRKRDGKALSDARVEIRQLVNGRWWGDSCSVLTGADGYFLCDNAWGSPLGDLDGRAMCWKDGYGVQVISYGFLKPGERARIEFLLDESAPFHGRVEDLDGKPRGGVALSAGENLLNLETTTTRADGTFTMHTLAKDYAFYFYVSGPGIAASYPTVPTPWPTEWPFVIRVEPTYTIEGRLLADGYPLEKPRVRAALEANRVTRLHESWVDADPGTGVFRFESLPPGRYYFDVITKGYSPKRVREIEVGKKTGGAPLEVRLEKGCRVRGVVRNAATGTPIEGATVGLADLGEVMEGNFYGTIDLGVTTDAEGRFEIESVEPGREAALSIEKKGYARFLDRFAIDSGRASIDRSIDLVGSGRLSVSVVRPDGQSAGEFTVTVVDPSGSEHKATGSSRATVEELSPSPHRVTIYLRDAIEDFRGAVRVYEDVVIREGEETTLNVSFAEGLAIRGKIHGEVARAYSGGFAAYAYLWKDGRWISKEFCEVRRSDLGFAIFGLAPGQYKVQVDSLDRQPMLAAAKTVDLTPDAPCTLDFEFGDYVLEGAVTDAASRPILGADLSMRRESESGIESAAEALSAAVSTATSASDGHFAVAGLHSGPYRVRIDAEGFARWRDRIVIDEREPIAREDFKIEPECRLRIEVVDRAANAVDSRTVTVMPVGATRVTDQHDASRIDSDGFHVVRAVGTGDYTLSVTAPGLFPHRSVVSCIAGEKRDVKIALRRLGSLRVVARDALGAPLKQLPFDVVDLETGETVASWITEARIAASPTTLVTDESGWLRIDGLPEGRYRVIGYGIDGEAETSFDPEAKPTTLAAAR